MLCFLSDVVKYLWGFFFQQRRPSIEVLPEITRVISLSRVLLFYPIFLFQPWLHGRVKCTHDTRQILAIGFLPPPCQSVLIYPPPAMPRGWIFLPKKMKNTLLVFISDMKNLLQKYVWRIQKVHCKNILSIFDWIRLKIEITGNNFIIKQEAPGQLRLPWSK